MNVFKKIKEVRIEDILKEWAVKNIKEDNEGYVKNRKPSRKLMNIICSLSEKHKDDKEVIRLWEEATKKECLRDWIYIRPEDGYKRCTEYNSCEECDIGAINICRLTKGVKRK